MSKPQGQTNNVQDTPGVMNQKFEYKFKQLQFNLTSKVLILSHCFLKEQDGFNFFFLGTFFMLQRFINRALSFQAESRNLYNHPAFLSLEDFAFRLSP